MRRLVVNLDNTLDEWLAGFANQNEIVRNALELYKGDITTDTVQGIRLAYIDLKKYMEKKFEYYDGVFQQLEKLISMLETRL